MNFPNRKLKNSSNKKIRRVFGWKHLSILFVICSTGILSLVSYYEIEPRELFTFSFYENLANPSVKVVRIKEGLRKEEIAEIMAEKLGWDDEEKLEFMNAHIALNTDNLEGKYFPKTYFLMKDQNPFQVSTTMFYEFSKHTEKIRNAKRANLVNPDTAIKIASIIQREAAGKNDMKLISGIIWNRLFNGMKLQMDATLQYAKGNESNGWWPRANPKDKSIDSPYNTYMYKDLPPSPIANPGLSAIEAAYNPIKTDCLYYLHDKYRRIHCAKTYEQHKRNITKYLN